ncbi:sugar phosphate nucleotidyltransferase [Bdellovibrio reynosensis]|uniref:NTP transferase domain-containing protein n=1 Tax=Bdellovibrio reynosensis TaxID=2835041 RepID=A0ABY4C6L0_9BACT|nr:sugar phosphate nucleotidyltransferase [Bdellovibrio reynosensis]UOF00540.1 NTP transferase domain-containing protein [Bdellovibrio reynosensis]
MNVMLLAAGEGTRLRPYTLTLPKPAIPFLTLPLAAHALAFLGKTPIDKLVVNTFHLPGKIHELFHSLSHGAKDLIFSDEVGEILGSGGGLSKARAHFIGGGHFVMMNADEVILPAEPDILEKALAHHIESDALATLLVMNHAGVGTQFGGVWADSKNGVRGFGKASINGGNKGWHFVGVQILSERVFDYLPKEGVSNILYDALTAAIQNGEHVEAFPFECSWFETGNPKDFLEASETCFEYLVAHQSCFQKDALETRIKKYGKDQIQVRARGTGKYIIAESAKVDESAVIEGLLVAGPQSFIGPGSKLKNVIVNTNGSVPAGAEISDSILL